MKIKPRFPENYSVYVIVAFLVLSLMDILREYSKGETMSHLSFEIFVCVSASLWTLYLWYGRLTAQRQLHLEVSERLRLNQEYQEWKTKNVGVLTDVQSQMTKQFSSWGLTPTETSVAFQLLKGLPFKEIAVLRDCSEKTVRQHALKIYQKSGLQGRTELFAFFFEDIFTVNGPN